VAYSRGWRWNDFSIVRKRLPILSWRFVQKVSLHGFFFHKRTYNSGYHIASSKTVKIKWLKTSHRFSRTRNGRTLHFGKWFLDRNVCIKKKIKRKWNSQGKKEFKIVVYGIRTCLILVRHLYKNLMRNKNVKNNKHQNFISFSITYIYTSYLKMIKLEI